MAGVLTYALGRYLFTLPAYVSFFGISSVAGIIVCSLLVLKNFQKRNSMILLNTLISHTTFLSFSIAFHNSFTVWVVLVVLHVKCLHFFLIHKLQA